MRYAEFTNRIGDRLEVRAEDGLVKLIIEAEAMPPAPPNVSVFEIDAAAFLKLVAGDLPRLTKKRAVLALEGEELFYVGTGLAYARDHNDDLALSAGVFDALIARCLRASAVEPIIPDLADRLNVEALMNDRKESHFSAQLVRLIAKADLVQREVLRAVYPEHVDMYERWLTQPASKKPPAGYREPFANDDTPVVTGNPVADRMIELGRVRTCRVCGCTDLSPCPGGCRWVGDDVCSACIGTL